MTGAFYRCEGDAGCVRWQSQKGDTYEEKVTCCVGCPKGCSPPIHPDDAIDSIDDEVQDLVDRIETLIAWENAGIATDWSEHTFDTQKLFVIWRDAETQLALLHQVRWQTFLKSKFKTD